MTPFTDTTTTFTNPAMTDRECATVDHIVATIGTIAMSRPDKGEDLDADPFTCQQDNAIQTLASLALAVIRHGALAGGGA